LACLGISFICHAGPFGGGRAVAAMTMQMDQNSKYIETDWLRIQRGEFDKERKAALRLRYRDGVATPPSRAEEVQMPEGIKRRPENHNLSGISKGWKSRNESFLPCGRTAVLSPASGPMAPSRADPFPPQAQEPTLPAAFDAPRAEVQCKPGRGRSEVNPLAAAFADLDEVRSPQRKVSRGGAGPQLSVSAALDSHPAPASAHSSSAASLRQRLVAPDGLVRAGSLPSLQGPDLRGSWSSKQTAFYGCRRNGTGALW